MKPLEIQNWIDHAKMFFPIEATEVIGNHMIAKQWFENEGVREEHDVYGLHRIYKENPTHHYVDCRAVVGTVAAEMEIIRIHWIMKTDIRTGAKL